MNLDETVRVLGVIEGYYPQQTYTWSNPDIRREMADSWQEVFREIPDRYVKAGLREWVSVPAAKFPLPGDILSVIAGHVAPMPSQHEATKEALWIIKRGKDGRQFNAHPIVRLMVESAPSWSKLGPQSPKEVDEILNRLYRDHLAQATREVVKALPEIILHREGRERELGAGSNNVTDYTYREIAP